MRLTFVKTEARGYGRTATGKTGVLPANNEKKKQSRITDKRDRKREKTMQTTDCGKTTECALATVCAFLENELMDVVRLFRSRPFSVRHSFRFEEGVFRNDFQVDGEEYSFREEAFPKDEVEYKRFERRFAKLGLYLILSGKYGEKMPWGALTGIRPTKLAYTERESGRDFEALFRKMGVCEENIGLVRDVLKTQEGIYEK